MFFSAPQLQTQSHLANRGLRAALLLFSPPSLPGFPFWKKIPHPLTFFLLGALGAYATLRPPTQRGRLLYWAQLMCTFFPVRVSRLPLVAVLLLCSFLLPFIQAWEDAHPFLLEFSFFFLSIDTQFYVAIPPPFCSTRAAPLPSKGKKFFSLTFFTLRRVAKKFYKIFDSPPTRPPLFSPSFFPRRVPTFFSKTSPRLKQYATPFIGPSSTSGEEGADNFLFPRMHPTQRNQGLRSPPPHAAAEKPRLDSLMFSFRDTSRPTALLFERGTFPVWKGYFLLPFGLGIRSTLLQETSDFPR